MPLSRRSCEPRIRVKRAKATAASTTRTARTIAVRRRGNRRGAAKSEALEQPVDVVAFDLRPRPLARAPTQLVEDLARLLKIARIGDGDIALRGAVARALAAERVAIGVAPRPHAARIAALGIALPLAHLVHLLGHRARRLLQLVERLGLRPDRLAA